MTTKTVKTEIKTTKLSSEFLKYTKNFSKSINSNFNTISPLDYLYIVMDTMHMFRLLELEIDGKILSESERKTVELLKKYKKWEYVKPFSENYVVFSTLRCEKFGIEYKLLIPDEKNTDFDNQIYSAILPNKKIITAIYKLFIKIACNFCKP
ncbi:conserved hypothetical protein [Methanococcus vannielii SB]|uniref:Uncharacterized protein n=1 Tax=Methanococcus vannielii (strain ATCC 35089 / DSM 1224 / JCM 13029 / OCM 148 / SB) TaxID=406327 RepID=A6UQF5_METVS|nr:hypothetical protein [Methanococcus vannielii]ABR54727.1 conserved hypothetical protein [Methanococcus vannielii SB]